MSPDEIKDLRKKLGLTAKQLAEALGVEGPEIFAWEQGERFPTKRYIEVMQRLNKTKEPDPTLSDASTSVNAPPTSAGSVRTEDPRLWAIVRKLVAHDELFQQTLKLAERFADPMKTD